MKHVAPLRYDVIFKKAFCDPEIFTAFVHDAVLYLCPKYANDNTPPALREWLRAINDTLDEQVEETDYPNPLIRRIFDLIEQDSISPEERARMFEEYNQEQVKRETFAEGEKEGLRKGKLEEKLEIARSLLAKDMALALIAEVTGLGEAEIAALAGV